jgi:predicted PhzF superfamily epimerase YddE/YHI9
MLKIAKELNLPETAFRHKNGMGYNLRWFTPNPKQK